LALQEDELEYLKEEFFDEVKAAGFPDRQKLLGFEGDYDIYFPYIPLNDQLTYMKKVLQSI
jgi:hypothetical protein